MQSQALHRRRQERTRSSGVPSRSARDASPSTWRKITAPLRAIVQFVIGVFYFLISIVAMVATAAIAILAVPIAIFAGIAVFALLIMAVGGVMDVFL